MYPAEESDEKKNDDERDADDDDGAAVAVGWRIARTAAGTRGCLLCSARSHPHSEHHFPAHSEHRFPAPSSKGRMS